MRQLLTLIALCLLQSGLRAYTVTDFIKVNQIGYRPDDVKVAVISDPQAGFNAAQAFVPGNMYELRDAATDAVVYSGTPTAWNSGATHAQSGDRAWWFDFSAFSAPGSYYVYDVANAVGSYPFDINDCVYADVLRHAVRMFYYQSCGRPKHAAFSGPEWADVTCHAGDQQDLDCRLYSNPDFSTSRNLSGGWHDAGDHNKYVNFTFGTLIDLLLAYEENPTVWTDDYGLPGSGNGRADLLDEVMYELDWILKMQNDDGSVLSMVGAPSYGAGSPPSADGLQRRYGPATTSASFTAAAVLALASLQYDAPYSNTLRDAAIQAYAWAEANPGVTFYNSGIIVSGEQEPDAYGTFSRQMAAAVFLYAATGNTAYRSYVDANHGQVHLMEWGYAYPFENAQQDALLYYASLPGATPSVADAIRAAFAASMENLNADNLPNYLNGTDAYRAYVSDQNYTWNSNQTKSNQGNMFLAMGVHGLNSANADAYQAAAHGFLDYFLGLNPLAKVYLSNLSAAGAENPVRSFYHSWFTDGSPLWDELGVSQYGPPPGYIPGGPNPTYALDPCCPSGCGSTANNAMCQMPVLPPLGQPAQKSYADINTGWPLNSWTVTEAGIYTNAAFVRMASKFAQTGCLVTGNSAPTDGRMARLLLYPDPARDEVTLSFSGMNGNLLQVELLDMGGRVLQASSFSLADGQNRQTLSLHLAPGTYVVRATGHSQVAVSRLVVH
jgi:hypothetical protein